MWQKEPVITFECCSVDETSAVFFLLLYLSLKGPTNVQNTYYLTAPLVVSTQADSFAFIRLSVSDISASTLIQWR